MVCDLCGWWYEYDGSGGDIDCVYDGSIVFGFEGIVWDILV